MALSDEQLLARLRKVLEPQEQASGVAYYALEVLPAGQRLPAPALDVVAPFEALVGFVDRDPCANWGHSSRYLLIDREDGRVVSIEAQLPPFGPNAWMQWRVAYRAPSVPDGAVAVSN